MALIVDVPLAGGFVAAGCYMRFQGTTVKKNYEDGTFYATAKIAAFKDATEAAKVGENGAPSGEKLAISSAGAVKVTGFDLESNGLVQLYAKLKTDLTAASITWAEE